MNVSSAKPLVARRLPCPPAWRRGRCALLFTAGATLACTGPGDTQAGEPQKGADAHPTQVDVATVTQRDVPIYLTALGTVAAWQTVAVRPVVEGRLAEVHFAEGQAVHKGELLARLDLRPFRIAVDNAEGALARDKATLDNARLNLRRNKDLQAQAMVSLQTVTDQAASVAQAQGAERVDEAALAQARYQLEQAEIVSPIDGITGVRQLDAGNLSRLTDGNGLVVVTQIDPAAVLLTLPEHVRHAVDVQMRQGSVPIALRARDDGGTLAEGEVRTIDNQIPQGSGTVRLKALAHNPNRTLWPGQFVKARLRLQVVPQAVVVPASAVQQGTDGEYVYVVDAAQTAQRRPIVRLPLPEGATTDAGPEAADGAAGPTTDAPPVLVAKGVGPGEVVVTDGQLRLRPGSRVATARAAGPGGAGH